MSNLNGLIKKLRDIMRNDPGINGDAQRIEQIVWMLFLKVYDAKEEEWECEVEGSQASEFECSGDCCEFRPRRELRHPLWR